MDYNNSCLASDGKRRLSKVNEWRNVHSKTFVAVSYDLGSVFVNNFDSLIPVSRKISLDWEKPRQQKTRIEPKMD